MNMKEQLALQEIYNRQAEEDTPAPRPPRKKPPVQK